MQMMNRVKLEVSTPSQPTSFSMFDKQPWPRGSSPVASHIYYEPGTCRQWGETTVESLYIEPNVRRELN